MTDERDPLIMKNPFMTHNNMEIVSVSTTESVVKATLTPESKNPYGMIHGGLIYSLMDICAGVTARADRHKYVTQSACVNYLSNTSENGDIIARSTVVKRGMHITVVRVTVETKEGTVLAEGTVDMFRVG